MYIKKIEESIPTGKISNTHYEGQDKAYSCEYVNKLTTYSTEEQVIGTWVNGKPLYRKVIIGTSTIVDQNNEIYHNIENVDEIMCSSESYIRIADNFFQLNRPSNSETNIDKTTIQSNLNKQAITLYVGSYLQTSGYNYSIVLEYTKTTD